MRHWRQSLHRSVAGLLWVMAAVMFVGALQADSIKGWFLAGSQPQDYEMGVEDLGDGKGKAAYLHSKQGASAGGFGTVMQNVSPERYRGQRVRLSGLLKSNDVKGWAGFWLRIDGKDARQPLAFDNMVDRGVRGTTEWQRYSIVLDVAEESRNIAFGFLLAGSGQLWADELDFEIVDESVPLTGIQQGAGASDEPGNLGFEGDR